MEEHKHQIITGAACVTTGVVTYLLFKEVKKNNFNKAKIIFNNSMKMASILVIPCAVGMIAISYPIIQIFFERGEFKTSDTFATAQILQILSLSLPALVYTKLYSNIFYARKDTRTPMIVAGISLLFNLFFTITLTQKLSYIGVVWAITISNWIGFLLLYYISYKTNLMYMYKRILKNILTITTVSIVMGMLIYFGTIGIIADISIYSLSARIMILSFLIIFGITFYFSSLFLLRIINFETIKKYIKKN